MSNQTRTVNPNEPFHFGEPEPNLNQQNFTSVNLNQTRTSKMVLKRTRTKPEPLKYFKQELNLNPNRYLKRFDTLILAVVNHRKWLDDSPPLTMKLLRPNYAVFARHFLTSKLLSLDFPKSPILC